MSTQSMERRLDKLGSAGNAELVTRGAPTSH